jgi:plasmid stabilization system protein ParE
MARPRIRFTKDAGRDLDVLFAWIAEDAGEGRAEAVLQRILSTIESVAIMPGMGRVRHDLGGAPRSFAVYPWVVLYRPFPEQDGITVLRVIDGRRDLPGQIRG